MTEGEHHWYQYYWCFYKYFFPPNILLLTVAIQHYSIIESYQFCYQHLLDFELKK